MAIDPHFLFKNKATNYYLSLYLIKALGDLIYQLKIDSIISTILV